MTSASSQLVGSRPIELATELQVTTLSGWRAFVAEDSSVPPKLGIEEYSAMSDEDRYAYDELRIDYHSRLTTLVTPLLRSVRDEGQLLVTLNRRAMGARPGLMVSGPWTTGKSTALFALGKSVETRFRRQFPGAAECVPVVFVSIPPASTPKALSRSIVDFLGLGSSGMTNVELTTLACRALHELHTQLVIVDEIHNLSLATRAGAEASDHIKYIAEHIGATFVYAGINVQAAGLFDGLRGGQIAGRFVLIESSRFENTTEEGRHQWRELVGAFEKQLVLLKHRPGYLKRLSTRIYDRTKGRIGSLSGLLRKAAIFEIMSGAEQITQSTLDGIRLDHAATSDDASDPPQVTRPRTRGKRRPAHKP